MASWADLDVGFEQRTPEGLMFFFFLEREEVAVEVAVKVELNGQRREEAKKKRQQSSPLSLLTLAARYAFLCARPVPEIHSPLPRSRAARASTPRSRASAVVALAAAGGAAMSVC